MAASLGTRFTLSCGDYRCGVAKNDELEQDEIEKKKKKNVSVTTGLSVALGPVLGVAVGIATHNIWLWLVIGIVMGITFGALRSR